MPNQLQIIIQIIHNIVNEPTIINILENSGLLPKIVQFLQLNLDQNSINNLLKIAYLLGKLSPPRQEQFVLNGIVQILVNLSKNQKHSGLCLSILAQCLQTSSITREKIWESGGPDIFFNKQQEILENYKLLDAISIWMEFDKSKFEVYFQSNTDKLVKIIRNSNQQQFQSLISIFLKLTLNLEVLSEQLSESDIFINELISRLQWNQNNNILPIVRKEILEILLILCVRNQRGQLIQKHRLNDIVYQQLQISQRENMVIVEEISSRLLEVFNQ